MYNDAKVQNYRNRPKKLVLEEELKQDELKASDVSGESTELVVQPPALIVKVPLDDRVKAARERYLARQQQRSQ